MSKNISLSLAIGIIVIFGGIVVWGVGRQASMVASDISTVAPRKSNVGIEKSQVLKSGYRVVDVRNPIASFSFEVPEHWASETRNSGEPKLSVEEKRAFLGTSGYLDFAPGSLEKMSESEMDSYILDSSSGWDPVPNASVSANGTIWFGDTSWEQVDFTVLKDFDGLKTYYNKVKESRGNADNVWSTKEKNWSSEIVGGAVADVVTFDTDRDEQGNEVITKGGTGGKVYYIRIGNGKDVLVIEKQAKGSLQFEEGFKNLLQTFEFTR